MLPRPSSRLQRGYHLPMPNYCRFSLFSAPLMPRRWDFVYQNLNRTPASTWNRQWLSLVLAADWKFADRRDCLCCCGRRCTQDRGQHCHSIGKSKGNKTRDRNAAVARQSENKRTVTSSVHPSVLALDRNRQETPEKRRPSGYWRWLRPPMQREETVSFVTRTADFLTGSNHQQG